MLMENLLVIIAIIGAFVYMFMKDKKDTIKPENTTTPNKEEAIDPEIKEAASSAVDAADDAASEAQENVEDAAIEAAEEISGEGEEMAEAIRRIRRIRRRRRR